MQGTSTPAYARRDKVCIQIFVYHDQRIRLVKVDGAAGSKGLTASEAKERVMPGRNISEDLLLYTGCSTNNLDPSELSTLK
jgi:hypothetical protein